MCVSSIIMCIYVLCLVGQEYICEFLGLGKRVFTNSLVIVCHGRWLTICVSCFMCLYIVSTVDFTGFKFLVAFLYSVFVCCLIL